MHFAAHRHISEGKTGSDSPADQAVVVSRGASYLTIQIVITSAAQVVSFAILARIISPAQMGMLAVLSLVTALCQAVDGSAFQTASTKFIGELSTNQREAASSVFYQTLRVSMIFSIPLAVIIFVGAPTMALAMLGTLTQAKLFQVLALDILVYAGAMPVGIGTLQGLMRFKAAAAIGSAGSVLRQCLIILLIILMKDFIGLVFAWVLSDFTIVVVYAVYIIHILGGPRIRFSLRRLLTFSWPLSIGNTISFGYNWFDRALLIVFVPLASLGVYNAALAAFGVLNSISLSLNNALLPVYADISGRQDGLERGREATRLASRYVSLTMIPFSLGLLATARPALTLFVGQVYVGGAGPLMILALVFGLTVFGITLSPMLLALSETRLVMWITFASMVAGLVSAYLLLPISDILGASIARGFTLIITTALTVVILHRKKAMCLDVEAIWKTIVAGTLMAGVLVIVQMVMYSGLLLPAYIVLGGAVYLVVLRVLKTVHEEDVNFISRYFGSRLNFVTRLLAAMVVSD